VKKTIVLTVLMFVAGGLVRAEDTSYFAASPGALAAVKARLAAHDDSLQPALKALIRSADKALQVEPPSVMEKTNTPPSGDKHDYMSVAPYFWPDPTKPDGLPYVRHDGKVNPESREDAFDHGRIGLMGSSVETLALAYYFTGNEDYAKHAAKFLRVWFLDPATRMNPNLEFAQAVPGENTGRGTGILEGRNIAVAADAAGLLADSPAWPQSDKQEFKAWLTTYLNWLLTSKNGRVEAGARNNHGTWYDVQTMELALVLGQNKVAKQIAESAKQNRIATQIEPDGQQPLELARTAAFSYARFNLEALFTLATLSENVGVDLWHCRLANGQYALCTALDFLLPFVTDPAKEWPYEQIKNFKRSEFGPELRQAATVYNDPKYEKILDGFPDMDRDRLQLLYPQSIGAQPKINIGEIECDRILKAASSALSIAPISITEFHAAQSPGGLNDFYSNGDYWWPDPTKTNGLPYIQRDGESNPGNFMQHRLAMRHLRDAVAALGAAYQITGDERYAQKAAELLRVFFLDGATRMNPSLQFAQAIPGRDNGRSFGIIDGLHLIEIPTAITAMQMSPAFTPELMAGLKKWFVDLTDWMVTSQNGKTEASAKNNHAVAYWLQLAAYSRFTGDEAKLADCRRQYKEVIIPNQMAANGSFPLELKRTKPYAYSIFQLDNLTTLCQVLSTPQENLWEFQLPDGRGIRKAEAYLYPFLADKSKWPLKPDVMAWDGWPARQSCLLFAGLAFDDEKYLDLWKRLPPDPVNEEVQRNIAVTQPILWLNDFSGGQSRQDFSSDSR
jgi:Alginate lyase